MAVRIYRASATHQEIAYGMVAEYYCAASVVLREDLQEFTQEYFDVGAGVWLAEVGGELVGCVALRRLQEKSGCAEIKRLYIRPGYRRQGIADRLLQALEKFAKQCGYQWLYLDTAADMKAAQRFYERQGFLPCERYNDNPQAAIFMRKAVGGEAVSAIKDREGDSHTRTPR
jgi:ribosomal protein S18 acetylase RimI-like enzyme